MSRWSISEPGELENEASPDITSALAGSPSRVQGYTASIGSANQDQRLLLSDRYGADDEASHHPDDLGEAALYFRCETDIHERRAINGYGDEEHGGQRPQQGRRLD